MKESKSNSPLEGKKIFHPTRNLNPFKRIRQQSSRLGTETISLTKEKTEKKRVPLGEEKSD